MTTFEDRQYQQEAIDDAIAHVSKCLNDPEYPRHRLYSAFMGTGKSFIMSEVRRRLRELTGAAHHEILILVPGPDIALGFIPEERRADLNTDDKVMAVAWKYGVTTAVRLRNRILDGSMMAPAIVLDDEAHHSVAATTDDIRILSGPATVWLGYTATTYRGTPKGTQALRDRWGVPIKIIGVKEAIGSGFASLPRFEVRPLIDDSTVKVSNGQFVAKAVDKAVASRSSSIALLCGEFYDGSHFDRPTMIATPGTTAAFDLQSECEKLGVPATVVTGETSRTHRRGAYEACRNRTAVLIQIAVVGEGVNLPWLRRLIDARPSLSPVAWFQLVGRICRSVEPGEDPPHYVGVCRNLGRHAYLFGDLIPPDVVAKEQDAFPPSKLDGARFLGFESVSRFKALPVKLADGTKGQFYLVEHFNENGTIEQWCAIASPRRAEPLYATRTGRGGRDWGRWQRKDALPSDLVGFSTSSWRGKASDKMREAWTRGAARCGLNMEPPTAGRDFAPFFVLREMNARIG